MKKAIIVTGAALVVAPLAVFRGYYGLQAYLDWLTWGATRPPTTCPPLIPPPAIHIV